MQLDKFDFERDLFNRKINESLVNIEKLLLELKWLDSTGVAKILVAFLDGISIQYLWFKQDYHLVNSKK